MAFNVRDRQNVGRRCHKIKNISSECQKTVITGTYSDCERVSCLCPVRTYAVAEAHRTMIAEAAKL